MKRRTRKRPIQLVTENGRTIAVIVGIKEYRKMLDKLEDIDDLRVLEEMRKRPRRLRPFGEYLKDREARMRIGYRPDHGAGS